MNCVDVLHRAPHKNQKYFIKITLTKYCDKAGYSVIKREIVDK